MNPTRVPFLDLVTPHVELEQELTEVFQKSLRTAGFIGGPMLEEFEGEFARFCETRYAVGVNSGTDALRFALMAAGVGPGDAVITVPNTFIATTEAISQAGAHPLFVDVDERTYNMDSAKLQKMLEKECSLDAASSGGFVHRASGKRVAAVVPVHLYGQMADMDAILALAEKYGLMVVEDACQAHGAEYFSRQDCHRYKAGSMGQAAAFSFYPGKNLGACGEAGAITTNDELIAKKCRMLRDHGQAQKYYHDLEGYNGRLDSIQAGILAVKLRHLAEWNGRRSHLAARYNELLSEVEGVVRPFEPSWSRAIHHLYVVRCQDRARLQKHLADAGIGTGIHYPIPLHLQKAYQHLGYKPGDFPVAERVAPEILSLPMFPQLSGEQQDHVVQTILAFLATKPASRSAAFISLGAAG